MKFPYTTECEQSLHKRHHRNEKCCLTCQVRGKKNKRPPTTQAKLQAWSDWADEMIAAFNLEYTAMKANHDPFAPKYVEDLIRRCPK